MSSPFIRTVQTAHYLLNAAGLSHIPILVEYGLAEGADWMGTNGICRTPWHLSAADLKAVSNKVDLKYECVKVPQFKHGIAYPGRPIEEDNW